MNARSLASSASVSRHTLMALFAAAALAAVACSAAPSESKGAPAPGPDAADAGAPDAEASVDAADAAPTSAEIDAACAAHATKLCAKLESCNAFDFALHYDTKAICTARVALECGDQLRSSSGTLTPAWQASCTAALDAYDCHLATSGYLPDACKPTPGKSTTSCAWSSDCASGFCEHVDGSKGPGCGVCAAAAPAEGSACGGTAKDECGFGLSCVAKKCVRHVGKDAACSVSAPCVAGFECFNGTCVVPLTGGDTCDVDAVTTPPCDSAAGLACGIGGSTICNGPAIGTAGEACIPGYTFVCPAGECNVDTNVCPAFAAEGGSCGEVCAPGARCVTGKCITPSASSCAPTSG